MLRFFWLLMFATGYDLLSTSSTGTLSVARRDWQRGGRFTLGSLQANERSQSVLSRTTSGLR